jgi:hypothetical protein
MAIPSTCITRGVTTVLYHVRGRMVLLSVASLYAICGAFGAGRHGAGTYSNVRFSALGVSSLLGLCVRIAGASLDR